MTHNNQIFAKTFNQKLNKMAENHFPINVKKNIFNDKKQNQYHEVLH